jgi:hypothetical protein
MSISEANKNISLSAIDAANATTEAWRFDPFPANLTFVNGTLKNGTLIHGIIYNGSAINGTTIIERHVLTSIGSIQLASFIYLIMSMVIVLAMLPGSVKWIQAASGHYHRFEPTVSTPEYPERIFTGQLMRYYPPLSDTDPPPSYAEVVNHTPSGSVTPEELRKGRQLLRAKYSLDCQIIGLKHVFESDRHIVEKATRQSQGAYSDLQRMAAGWVNARNQWTAEEFRLVTEISNRITNIQR